LLNNILGKFNPSPSVKAGLDSFQDSIKQLLWLLGHKVPGTIDRITDRSYIRLASGYLPDFLNAFQPARSRSLRFLTKTAFKSLPSQRERLSACSPT